MKKPKLYCHKCGALCNLHEVQHGYDQKTGKPIVEYRADCPTLGKVRWFDVPSHTYNEWAGGYDPRPDGGW